MNGLSGMMQALIVATAGLGGIGVYLLMPRASSAGRAAGVPLAIAGGVLLWLIWLASFRDAGAGARIVFLLLATQTVLGGVMTVTQRNPVSCALWFACVVIGTAGLFLLQNAQFLAAAIVIVYAGAIIVMFLFVIMMAQQTGGARYDRVAREPALAVGACFVLLIALVSTIAATYRGPSPVLAPLPPGPGISPAALLDDRPDAPLVARLGTALFTEHAVSLEVAGTLLLVAMVGAIVIAARKERA